MSVAVNSFAREFTTILYVDDEELARKYFALSLEESYEVLTAAGADEAVAILREKGNLVSILITDYRMPGRDGGDLLRQVEREFPYVVRILVTAYADRKLLLETVNSGGVFRVLEKPLNFGEVRKALRLAHNLLQEREARQQNLMAMNEALSFLAHELNTPLVTIVNFARGLQQRVANGNMSQQQKVETEKAALAMNDNARYCLLLLSSFVESVQGAEAIYAQHSASTAQHMIANLLETYPLTLAQKALIRVDVQQDFAIAALPNCMALVLSTLLGNALRAVQNQAEPMVLLTVLVEDHPQICISDNGSGIPQEVLERLLIEPITTYADVGGTGWGLLFCKRIMQSFEGNISIHTVAGVRTTFKLNFPPIK